MTELPGQLADPGRYLRAQRELADVSRNTLARLARVSESYLTQVEKGQSSRLLRPGPARTSPVRTVATAGLPRLLIRRISSGRRLARHVLRRHSRSDNLRVDCRPRRVRDADARFG